ncbi:MAG: cystathionine beta-lyase [Alphaproteobacteria bacterium]
MLGKEPETLLTHAGNAPEKNQGIVNPPVYHASTVIFPSVAYMEEGAKQPYEGVRYGRYGTPTSRAFEDAVAALEGGYRAVVTSSGLNAITTALLAFVKSGDHLLLVDNCYYPTRQFAEKILSGLGVTTSYYPPEVGENIADYIRPNTRMIYLESPGSFSFEMQDVPAITRVAKERGILTMMDNTWATPLFFQPLAHGVDLSIQAATKYIVGHSDAMLGVITAKEEVFWPLKTIAAILGVCAGPDDVYLGLRGLRSLAARLAMHQQHALTVAEWLSRRSEVVRVIHPARPDHPGYHLWQRDYHGSTGLFAVILDKVFDKEAVTRMVESCRLFGLGYSWGGYESLIMPFFSPPPRDCTPWQQEGTLLRLHVGLEAVTDLLHDLEEGLKHLHG